MQARNAVCEQVCHVGEQLLNNRHYAHRDIETRVKNLRDKWAKLYDLAKKRRTRLEDAAESHQVNYVLSFQLCNIIIDDKTASPKNVPR